jgi:hypothetical protein
MNSRASGSSGFGSRFEVIAHGVEGEPLQDRRQHHAGHPVPRVDDDAERLDRVLVDEGQDLLDIGRPDVGFVDVAGGLSP